MGVWGCIGMCGCVVEGVVGVRWGVGLNVVLECVVWECGGEVKGGEGMCGVWQCVVCVVWEFDVGACGLWCGCVGVWVWV